ncbi:cysteine--tRNA ligase [Ethanoligenens harbinense]|nr:cysteine--tRNA ligase [Ethanoligenens harbinense]AVQ97350.1 cysteine--tRNA ligase [Ethanoligenens harbinense YUAN-3]AYF40009.1 cysteine--tRNA ligase [Ethanoligenens harbinense]AYF42840.1 cysteine--tRNA ligase [Ethanoligenens harbinense]QCN93597.1 cysteine--tRNA ligase [Ethanoligenens harbinense]
MKIYNTLTREKDEFVPIKPGEARIYACGPTVYNYIHVGNARPMVVFDILRRYLEYRGYKVLFAQNFTDVDDKMIRRANEEGVAVAEVAEKYIAAYREDAAGLHVREATFHPRATENIADILALIRTLEQKGYAYASDGDVYFRAHAFKEYGKLSHQPLEDLEAGARVDVSERKEDPVDFALWKAAKPGEPSWDSPWGPGRPGWHIECSAMARHFLGQTIDIHCGGQDLIFPHHENEIAQSECANDAPFAHYWMHNGYINIDNRKMSKSLGNFFTVREVAAKYGYEPIRFLMLSAQYRTPINFSDEIMEQSVAALDRLYRCREALKDALRQAGETPADSAAVSAWQEKFDAAMDDDLNTADALAVLFELVKEINTRVAEGTAGADWLKGAAGLFGTFCDVLGLLYERKERTLDAEVEVLIEKRRQARKAKDFKTADAIRDELSAKGIVLKDTPQGVKWEYKKSE